MKRIMLLLTLMFAATVSAQTGRTYISVQRNVPNITGISGFMTPSPYPWVCTPPQIALRANSTDARGMVTVTTGTGCGSVGGQDGSALLTFSTSDGSYSFDGVTPPTCMVTLVNADGSWLTPSTSTIRRQTPTQITIDLHDGSQWTPLTTYSFNYVCIGAGW